MPIADVSKPVRTSLIDGSLWYLEWVMGASGAVTLTSAQSDEHPGIATPVADGGTGITSVRFPRSRRVRIMHLSLEPATEATGSNYLKPTPINVNPAAGTMSIYYGAANGGNPADPEASSIVRLHLLLEHP